jgi:hypothetical protein
MPAMRYLVVLAIAACSPAVHSVQLVNHTSRAIEQVYIYPLGASDHGASKATLAPNATATVSVQQGNVEVLAVSAKVQIDEHTRDRPSVSYGIELKGPVEVVFYDVDNKPAGLDRPGVVAVPFTLRASNAPPQP